MTPRPFITSAGLALLTALSLHAADLLSGNESRFGSASYPGDTTKIPSTGRIATGASYTYLTDAAANTGIGNTDADIIKMDAGLNRLLDGYNERVGNTAIFGSWRGQHGATVVLDLKQTHDVHAVSASVREDSSRGTATFQAFVSTDGATYTPLGVWDGAKVTLDTAEGDAGRNTEISITAPAPVQARYIKLYFSHWDETRASRKYQQLVVGEVAIWGSRR